MGQIKKEILRFIISGSCATIADVAMYYILSNFVDISIAKGASYLSGLGIAYLMNKYFTFESKEKNIKETIKFFSLYFLSLCANVTVNRLCFIMAPLIFKYIQILNNYQILKLFAFLTATATSTIMNFLGLKFWVFKKKIKE